MVGIIEERIDELTAKMELSREDMELSTQAIFNKIASKVDELKLPSGAVSDQKQTGRVEALIPVISNLAEHLEEISKKVDTVQQSLKRSG